MNTYYLLKIFKGLYTPKVSVSRRNTKVRKLYRLLNTKPRHIVVKFTYKIRTDVSYA